MSDLALLKRASDGQQRASFWYMSRRWFQRPTLHALKRMAKAKLQELDERHQAIKSVDGYAVRDTLGDAFRYLAKLNGQHDAIWKAKLEA